MIKSSVNPRTPGFPQGIVGLDFETYGDVNLPKYGLDRYVSDPSFTALIASVSDKGKKQTFDFVEGGERAREAFREYVNLTLSWGYWFSAHNVGFERAVMQHLGFGDDVLYKITDSAVVARAQGAASHLEAAAPQLTDIQKLEVGKNLIMTFSVPTEANGGRPYTWDEIQADPNLKAWWDEFCVYCEVDAEGSAEIVTEYITTESFLREHEMEWYTYLMNRAGWNVDLDLVREMQLRFEENSQQIVSDFFTKHMYDDGGNKVMTDKFLNSTPQMKAWCAERGIKTNSFDAEHITKLLVKIQSKLKTMNPRDPKYSAYEDVEDLLVTKRDLGGSSLAKLQKILDLTSEDGRLRNQYMHLGAGQSYRSTGKGVQLQNLKRLSSSPMDLDDDFTEVEEADNTTLAENLRQVFISDEPDGRQIVGDFSSVESRGLAWIAGDDVKIQAFKDGKDLYKVQAVLIHGTPYEQVTKAERQDGKVAELGCGYGAGPVALQRFAGKMGIEMDEDKALEIVRGWRGTNPNVVDLWDRLGSAFSTAVTLNAITTVRLAHHLLVEFHPFDPPKSLAKQHPGARSVRMKMLARDGDEFVLERVFHGCYMRGEDVCFYKPSDRKTGDLWRNHYRDPKTGKTVFYKLYGGKLTGILVQSMCRELFFDAMQNMFWRFEGLRNVTPIGQFHDELVVSWTPVKRPATDIKLDSAMEIMRQVMSTPRASFTGFPLEGDIKSDYRYTK
ncbi:DNA polymerase I [Microbacterium phage Arete]|uniref:DNA polymerase n=1 Tax=Microbacterium phage Arete TaxID=2713257 RepID=A0A6G8R134_9CAUD|nr:DNA polymerase I [Microbacterium phage Arete]QIN93894.1 DNA polymerase I [Microbacterium phage Arete]